MKGEYFIAQNDEKMCFLRNRRTYFMLRGDIKGWLQKLDALCFNYHHVDCLYTLFKSRFNRKIVVKSGKLSKSADGTSFQPPKQRGGQNVQQREKETPEEKAQKTFVEILPKN